MQLKTTLLAAAIMTAGLAVQPFQTAQAAGSASTDMTVKITIQNACDGTVTASDMDFGTAGPLTTKIDRTSTINVTCTKDAPFTIELGSGGSGDVTARTMTDGTNFVNYQLYTDNTYATVWGDSTGGTIPSGMTGTGTSQDVTVYGEVPAQTTPPAGDYSDTVQVTLNF